MNINFLSTTIEYDDSGIWGYVEASSHDIYIVRYNNSNPYTTVIVPNSLTINSIETPIKGTYELFYKDEYIEKVEFSAGIEIIGDYTCYECPELREIIFKTVPNVDGVRIIGNYCFWYCNIEDSILFPDSLEDIGDGSFCNNYDLRVINFPSSLWRNRSDDDNLSIHMFRSNPNLTFIVNSTDERSIEFLREYGYNYQIIGGQINTISGGSNQKYFLAGVANAEIFDGDKLFATAKTLIDSSITMGVSAEDIRAGQGAKLYGKYFHTSTFDLKMTDAMFDLRYIQANVGGEIEFGGDVLKEERVKCVKSNYIEISELPKPLNSNGDIYVYYKQIDDIEYKCIDLGKVVNDKNLNIDGLQENVLYCVKYIYNAEGAKRLIIPADYVPKTLSVFLTANLYSGDSNNPFIGTKAGTITIKIPRFLLSGSQEISMSMTGATTIPIEGSALATQGEYCSQSIYAEIIENIFGRTLDDITALKIQDGDDILFLKSGDNMELSVFGKYKDSYFCKMDNTKLLFTSMLEECVSIDERGVITAKSTTYGIIVPIFVTIKDRQNPVNAVIGVVVR